MEVYITTLALDRRNRVWSPISTLGTGLACPSSLSRRLDPWGVDASTDDRVSQLRVFAREPNRSSPIQHGNQFRMSKHKVVENAI